MADTWAVEHGVVPLINFESYGAVWSHELGHNFGRQHAGDAHNEEAPQDLSFPYPHGGIGEPGLALTTEWWNASPFLMDPGIPATGQKHAHDFMSYGDANDLDDHTHDWISPYTYKALFQQFLDLKVRSAPASPPRQKLIVRGSIAKSGDVVFRPFRIATTAFAGESAESTEYRIELQDAAGKELASQPVSISRRDGSSLKYFSAYIPWHPETKKIVMKDKNKILSEREVSSHKPSLRILSPKGGEIWGPKATITWKATDEDGDNLTFTVLYNTGQDNKWIPLAAGLKKQTVTINTGLVPGSKKARIRVQVTDGVNTTEADSSGTFVVPEKPPLVAILGLKNGMTLSAEESNLAGAAYDPQEGMLLGGKLKWISSRDGVLGEGAQIAPRRLAAGAHTITLTATNSRGQSATVKVNVIVRGTRVSGYKPVAPAALRFPANTPR
jgi:hypothetical protein